MGVFVGLRILPDCISDEEWTSFYTESRYFLTRYSPRLASIRVTQFQSALATHKRLVASRNIEIIDDNTKKPYLRIDGTLRGLSFAETFTIPSSIASKREGTPAGSKDKDIEFLLSDAPAIFFNKTQGFPYHYAILALGILAENHFPGRAAVLGDITSDQAKISIEKLHGIFERDFSMPLATDPVALHAFFSKGRDALKTCEKTYDHFRCEEATKMVKLAQVVDRQVFESFLKKGLCNFKPGTFGMFSVATDWLNTMPDPAGLIRALVQDSDGPGLSQERCAEILAGTGIALDPSYEEKIAFIRSPCRQEGTADTVYSMLGHFVMLTSGFTCQHALHCLGEQAVLDAFSAIFPDKEEPFRTVLHENTGALQKTIDLWHEEFASIERKIKIDPGVLGADSLRFFKPCDEIIEDTDFSNDYTLTRKQKELLKDEAARLAPAVETLAEECRKKCTADGIRSEPERMRCTLYVMAEKKHAILPESTWKKIDNEKDFRTLCLYMALLCNDDLRSAELHQVILNSSELLSIVLDHIRKI